MACQTRLPLSLLIIRPEGHSGVVMPSDDVSNMCLCLHFRRSGLVSYGGGKCVRICGYCGKPSIHACGTCGQLRAGRCWPSAPLLFSALTKWLWTTTACEVENTRSGPHNHQPWSKDGAARRDRIAWTHGGETDPPRDTVVLSTVVLYPERPFHSLHRSSPSERRV